MIVDSCWHTDEVVPRTFYLHGGMNFALLCEQSLPLTLPGILKMFLKHPVCEEDLIYEQNTFIYKVVPMIVSKHVEPKGYFTKESQLTIDL